MKDKNSYLVVVKGKSTGPFDLQELSDLNIEPHSFVKRNDMDDYKEAHELEEIRALLNFNIQYALPQYFAAFDLRLLASVIDYFFITLIVTFCFLIILLFMDGIFFKAYILVVFLPALILFKFIYACFADASTKQGTLGKRLTSIKVTDLNGRRIALSVSIVRNFSKIISTFPFFFGYLYSFLNKKNQCFHDLIANTLVIKDRLI